MTWLDKTDRVDRVAVTYDAGGSRSTDYDERGAYDWSHISTDLDALGRTTFEAVLGDDNSRRETTFDIADSAVWDRLEVLTAATGETFTLVTGAEGQELLFGVEGEDRLEMSIDGLVGDDLLTFSSESLGPLTQGFVQGPAGAKTVELLLAVAAFVWGQKSGGGMPTEGLPGPNGPGTVAGEQVRHFFDRGDGTNYYLSESGKLWEVKDNVWDLATTIPNSTLGTDAFGACAWTIVNESNGADATWKAYQEQITGLPSNLACVAETSDGRLIKFDGYDYARGTYIEAVGPNMLRFYDENGAPYEWYRNSGGFDRDMQQITDQVNAARGRPVEIVVAEQGYQQILNHFIVVNNLSDRVTVRWEPPK